MQDQTAEQKKRGSKKLVKQPEEAKETLPRPGRREGPDLSSTTPGTGDCRGEEGATGQAGGKEPR